MSKYIFRNELGGYESTYDKNSLMRLCYEEISDLEAKLAESEKQLNSAQVGEQFALKCCKDASEQNKRVLEKIDLIVRSNQELEQQLAEKDKEIQSLTNKNSRLIQGIFWGNGIQFSHEHQKGKIEFAIAELQRVETYFEKHGSISYYIYHRINELKEMK